MGPAGFARQCPTCHAPACRVTRVPVRLWVLVCAAEPSQSFPFSWPPALLPGSFLVPTAAARRGAVTVCHCEQQAEEEELTPRPGTRNGQGELPKADGRKRGREAGAHTQLPQDPSPFAYLDTGTHEWGALPPFAVHRRASKAGHAASLAATVPLHQLPCDPPARPWELLTLVHKQWAWAWSPAGPGNPEVRRMTQGWLRATPEGGT